MMRNPLPLGPRPHSEGRTLFSGLLLDLNENTIPPSPHVQRAIKRALRTRGLQYYPEYSHLIAQLAQHYHLSREQLLITNGADHAIDLIVRAFIQPHGRVIIPHPSFRSLHHAPLRAHASIHQVHFSNTFAFPIHKLLRFAQLRPHLLLLCNPNNPTGTFFTIDEIRTICKTFSKSIVCLDEAYIEYSGGSSVPLTKTHPNLIIVQTFSKAYGLAGLRCGVILGSKNSIEQIRPYTNPFDVNMFAVVGVEAALDNDAYVHEYIYEVMHKAKPYVEQYLSANNIPFVRSHANFILFFPPHARTVFQQLRKHGILTHFFHVPSYPQGIRVTIGTRRQMQLFCKRLSRCLK